MIAGALREIAAEAPAPRPRAESAWRAGRRRRTARLTAAAASGAAAISAAVLIPLAGLPGAPVPGGATPEASGGGTPEASTFSLGTPVQFRQVASVSAVACPAGSAGLPDATTPLSSCVRLTGAGLTVTRMLSVRLVRVPYPSSGYSIDMRLTAADARRLETLTERLAGQPTPRCELAIIVRGRVVAAPVMETPIADGRVQITGFASRAQAQRLFLQFVRIPLPHTSILRH